jgi:hypothetical protein
MGAMTGNIAWLESSLAHADILNLRYFGSYYWV